MRVEDIVATHKKLDQNEILIAFEITGLSVDCLFDWAYEYGIRNQVLSNDGDGKIIDVDVLLIMAVMMTRKHLCCQNFGNTNTNARRGSSDKGNLGHTF